MNRTRATLDPVAPGASRGTGGTRMSRVRFRVALTALLIAGTLGRTAAAADDDPSLREWNQARGNTARTGVVAVEPIRSEPVEGWRLPIDGSLLGGPVT